MPHIDSAIPKHQLCGSPALFRTLVPAAALAIHVADSNRCRFQQTLKQHCRELPLLRRGRLRLLSLRDFFGPELRNPLDQLHWDRLREREADRALTELVRCKLLLESSDQALASRIERVVLLPPGEIEDAAIVQFVSRDLV